MQNFNLRVDRIEEDIVIAFSNSGKKFSFPKSNFDIKESDIISVTLNENGEVFSISILQEDTENAKVSLRERLKKLFKK